MRLPQAEDEHRDDILPAAKGAFTPQSPSGPVQPAQPAASTCVSADLAALAHILTAHQPVEDALAQALLLGAQLLADCCVFRLFARDGGRALALRQVASLAYASDGRPYTSGEEAEGVTSLGRRRLDHDVLLDRLAVRDGDTTYIPLTTGPDAFVGVLAVTHRDSAAGRATDSVLVTLLADHFTVLLERRLRERFTTRLSDLTADLARLGDPKGVAGDATGSAAEQRIFRDAAALLRRVALPCGLLALAVSATGQLEAVAGASDHTPDLAPALSATLLRSLGARVPLLVSPLTDAGAWTALAPVRDTLSAESASGDEIARLVLLPVVSGETPLGLFVLAQPPGALEPSTWIPLATAIATAAAAGIRVLQQADATTAEARARDAFISLTGHELRSPLTSIKGYSQLLIRQARRYPLPDSMVRSVQAIEQQSVRMADMVGELLDASRIQRGTLEVLPARADLVVSVSKAVDRRRPFLQDQELVLELDEPSLAGQWDASRVEQIVRDLLDNASRFSPDGKAIYVRVCRDDDMGLVSVRDEGIGIADPDRTHIFDYLYRSPEAEQRNLTGLGLGLFVGRYLAEKLGGSLTLHATSTVAPTGSEFHLRLPLA